MSQWWKNTETVRRYSSKYILSNVNQVETFWPCYCCSLPKMQITHSVSHRHMLFFRNSSSFVPLKFKTFILVCLLLSPCFCPPPFVVNSTLARLQHFNLCRCSPSLKAALLNASPPRLCSVDSATPPWLPGTMALHKGPRSILHLQHQIPLAQGDSHSKSHSPAKHTHTMHAHKSTHTDVCLGLAVIFILYFWEKDAFMLERERERPFNKRC